MTFEFGNPHLRIREPQEPKFTVSARVRRNLRSRSVHVCGDWHLWIYFCDWVVYEGKRVVGDKMTHRRVDRAAAFLNGQKLVGVEIRPRGTRCRFEFDLGGVLETKPYDRTSEQWMLFTPDGMVLTVRAGGKYSFMRGDEPEDNKVWRSIPAAVAG